MKTTKHYRIITPGTYSNIDLIQDKKKGYHRVIKTIEEAKEVLADFGTADSEEYGKYWKEQQALCKIVHVTTIIEDVAC